MGLFRIPRTSMMISPAQPSPMGLRLRDPRFQLRIVNRLTLSWLVIAAMIGGLKLAFAPDGQDTLSLPYIVAALLPAFALAVGYRIFRTEHGYRFAGLSLTGRWVPVNDHLVKNHPLYGNDGLMIMLGGGLLFSIAIRAFDFYTAMPPLFVGAPPWLPPIYALLLLDMLLLSGMYAVSFAAALRHSPFFPLLLSMTWLLDMGVLVTGLHMIEGWSILPSNVEAQMVLLLSSNIQKAMISVTLWAPYLLLSRRVNVTFLRRVRPNDLILLQR